jgi:hypothetical protein
MQFLATARTLWSPSQCASSQLRPIPTSTLSGTAKFGSRAAICSRSWLTTLLDRSSATSRTSSSCTCMMSRAGTATLQPGVDLDHGALDDIGGGALHGGVDGAALGVLAQSLVARLDLGQIQPPSEYGFHEARFARLARGLVHVALHAGIALEIKIDVFLRLAAPYAQLTREAERRHAVDQAEIDRLGGAPLIGGHLSSSGTPKHLGGGRLVDVAILGERFSKLASPDRCAMMRSSICE